MTLVICLDSFTQLQRFTNQPWAIESLHRIIRNAGGAAGRDVGIPLNNILRDYEEGKLKRGDKVVCATGTSQFGAHYTIAPSDGKVDVYGHGYRAGLADIGYPVGPGALQKWNQADEQYENEELNQTVRNFINLFGAQVERVHVFKFYSCGSGGKPANSLIVDRSFAEAFRAFIRHELGRDNIYVHGIAGAFTKRYNDQEWRGILGGVNLRPELKNSYYSIFQESANKIATLSKVLRCAQTPESNLVAKYLSRLSEYEVMNRRERLGSQEKTTLRKLYYDKHTIVAISMPNGQFTH